MKVNQSSTPILLRSGIQGRIRRERGRIIFFCLSLVAIIAIMISLPRLSMPMGIAYILSLIMSPLLPWLSRLRFNRTFSVAVVLLVLGSVTMLPIIKIVPLVQGEIGKLNQYIPKIESFVTQDYQKYNNLLFKKTGIRLDDSYVASSFDYLKVQVKQGILNLPNFLASLFEWIILVPFFLFFFLRDHKQLRNLFLSIVPNVLFERIYFLTNEFNRKLGDYIFAKFVEASLIGIIITVGLSIMGINFWLIWGIIAAITNIIPYLGPILGALPALVVTAVEYGVGPTFWAVAILFAVANIIDLAIVFPILVSKIVDLHPLVVVISVILGSQLFGVLGMVISIPLAAAAKLLITEIYKEIYLTASK